MSVSEDINTTKMIKDHNNTKCHTNPEDLEDLKSHRVEVQSQKLKTRARR